MHYKRPEVQRAIVEQSLDKEVSVMFGLAKFGKRPDIISYENDVLEFAKRKASSFHCSEEIWRNPLLIKTGMSRKELDELRIGWDLIFDIDCPDWKFSKLITHLFIKALNDHGISSVSTKFSGNKGFHIAVPFESFPDQIPFKDDEGNLLHKDVKDLFPEAPRKIAIYLLSFITENYASIRDDGVDFDGYFFTLDYLKKIITNSSQSLVAYQCSSCHSVLKSDFQKPKSVYRCSKCGHESHPQGNPDVIRCENCSHPVELLIERSGCPTCGSKDSPVRKPNLLAVVEVDTVLISSRHLYRMPYSLHEKSGLVSIPLRNEDILLFEKSFAKPENIHFDIPFLTRSTAIKGEASNLFVEAFDRTSVTEEKKYFLRQEIPIPEDAIAEEFFPPCIHKILAGLEDGKKRAMFVLINFLRVSGWGREQIGERLRLWNKNNPQPLKEQYLRGQLFQIKKGKSAVPPPNCSNDDYYKSLLICNPDSFCSRVKNPAMYAKRKYELEQQASNKKTKKKAPKKKIVDKKPSKDTNKKDSKTSALDKSNTN